MPMVPFFTQCPETAEADFRTVKVIKDAHIPPGEYDFLELYCDEPDCDCRRVFILVVTPTMQSKEPFATINFGWESEEFYREWMHDSEEDDFTQEMKGPSLALAPQSELAPPFLALFQSMARDKAYVDRLRRHYRLFREAIDNKHAGQAMHKSGVNTHASPNAPCPCGSAKKYKKCCGRMV